MFISTETPRATVATSTSFPLEQPLDGAGDTGRVVFGLGDDGSALVHAGSGTCFWLGVTSRGSRGS